MKTPSIEVSHVNNFGILMGISFLLGSGSILLLVGLVWELVSRKSVSDTMVGLVIMIILGALPIYWLGRNCRQFVRFARWAYGGAVARGHFVGHKHERIQRRGSKGGTYTRDTYSGEVHYQPSGSGIVYALIFSLDNPGTARREIKDPRANIEVLYLPGQPLNACLAWEGAAYYRLQIKRILRMVCIFAALILACFYDLLHPKPVLPETFKVLMLALGIFIYPIVAGILAYGVWRKK